MSYPDFLVRFWQDIAGWAVLVNLVLTAITLLWVLHIKREPMSAIAWSLAVVMLPFLGPILFALFGFQTIHRPIQQRQKRRKEYRRLTAEVPAEAKGSAGAAPVVAVPRRWEVLAKLAHHADGFPVTSGNRVTFYHLGEPAYAAMLQAIATAKHHIHMQFFIVRADESGRRFLEALAAARRRGIEVRFLYDSVGSYWLSSRI